MIRRSQILYMFLTFATLFLLIFHNPIVAEFEVQVSPNSVGHLELQYWRKISSFSVNQNPPLDVINFFNLSLFIAAAISSIVAILYARHIKNQNFFIVLTFLLIVTSIIFWVVDLLNVKSRLGNSVNNYLININLIWIICVLLFALLGLFNSIRKKGIKKL